MKALLAKAWKLLKLPKGAQLFFMRLFQNQFLVGVTGIIFNEKKTRCCCLSTPIGSTLGASPAEALEREIKEESNLVVSADKELKTRTDRSGARLDICYTGVLIGGDFTPSQEVSKSGFFSQDKMPLLRSNQVFLIAEALQQKGLPEQTK